MGGKGGGGGGGGGSGSLPGHIGEGDTPFAQHMNRMVENAAAGEAAAAPPPSSGPPENFWMEWLNTMNSGGGGHHTVSQSHHTGPSSSEIEEKNRITEGENKRDRLYSEYLDAADAATNYINEQIVQEESNAALRGVEYLMDDEIKSTRISNYFSTIWSASDQTALESAFSEFGNPEGFEDYIVTRGEEVSESADGGDDVVESTSQGAGAGSSSEASLLDEEDEPTTNLLGA